MKKFLQYAGIISAVLAIAAFIFLMAGNALVYKYNDTAYFVPGTRALFGGEVKTWLGTVEYKPAATALVAWILVLVAILILVAGVVLPLLKVKGIEKIAGILNLVAVGALLVAGILLFFTKGVFSGANSNAFDDYKLTFAHVLAAILAVSAGAIAIAPTVVGLLGKK